MLRLPKIGYFSKEKYLTVSKEIKGNFKKDLVNLISTK